MSNKTTFHVCSPPVWEYDWYWETMYCAWKIKFFTSERLLKKVNQYRKEKNEEKISKKEIKRVLDHALYHDEVYRIGNKFKFRRKNHEYDDITSS